jgi:hypothetical protein
VLFGRVVPLEERSKHDWLIFANAIVLPEGGQRASVVTAVCKRCGDVRSSLSPVDGEGRIELTGECSGTGAREPSADIR